MKTGISLFMLILFLQSIDVRAANSKDTMPAHDSVNSRLYYEVKAKKQLVTGAILFISGAVMATTGLGLVLSGLNHLFEPGAPPPKDYGSWPDILGYGGLILMGASIFFFIRSKRNKYKAKRIAGNKRIVLPYMGFKPKNGLSAGIVMNF